MQTALKGRPPLRAGPHAGKGRWRVQRPGARFNECSLSPQHREGFGSC